MSLFDTGVRPAIDQWLLDKAKEQRDYGEYFSASSAGYCQRKVIFERLGVPKVENDSDARKQRVFTSGHLFHDWIQGITKVSGVSIAQELELQDESLMIRGHIDDLVLVRDWDEIDEAKQREMPDSVVHVPSKLILYDYKTVNSRSFMWAKKNGNAMSYYHRMQLGTYMYMLRSSGKKKWLGEPQISDRVFFKDLTEARILKIEKDTLMMMEQQLMWSPELESDVVYYWTSLNTHWKNKTFPKCTCADVEGGFMALEKWNPYFAYGEPCSLTYYLHWKKNETL